jgi:hypothetical protein
MKADQIAAYISAAATECLAGNLTLEQHGQINGSFWELADALGLHDQVHALLQEESDREWAELALDVGPES